MGDVVNLHAVKKTHKEAQESLGYGEANFILCRTCSVDGEEGPGFAVGVTTDAHGPIIIALVCLGCEAHMPIEYGRMVED